MECRKFWTKGWPGKYYGEEPVQVGVRNKSLRGPQPRGCEGAGQIGGQGRKTFHLRHKCGFLTILALGHLARRGEGWGEEGGAKGGRAGLLCLPDHTLPQGGELTTWSLPRAAGNPGPHRTLYS